MYVDRQGYKINTIDRKIYSDRKQEGQMYIDCRKQLIYIAKHDSSSSMGNESGLLKKFCFIK